MRNCLTTTQVKVFVVVLCLFVLLCARNWCNVRLHNCFVTMLLKCLCCTSCLGCILLKLTFSDHVSHLIWDWEIVLVKWVEGWCYSQEIVSMWDWKIVLYDLILLNDELVKWVEGRLVVHKKLFQCEIGKLSCTTWYL